MRSWLASALFTLTSVSLAVPVHAHPVHPSALPSTWQTPLAAASQTLLNYLELGVEHVVIGFDHIAFVIGITLATGSLRHIMQRISVFTLAHSLTLIIAALQVVTLPSPLVESVIALSVIYIGASLWFPRWHTGYLPIIFIFGLLHGLGFAAALADIGLPSGFLLPSLISFNVGVEVGQLAIVALTLAGLALAHRLRLPQRYLINAAAVTITAAGLIWLTQRLVAGL